MRFFLYVSVCHRILRSYWSKEEYIDGEILKQYYEKESGITGIVAGSVESVFKITESPLAEYITDRVLYGLDF